VALPGTVVGQTDFTSVSFRQTYSTIPLVFVLPTTDGGDPCDIRIRNVTTAGFELSQVEPPPKDGAHAAMTVSYFAIEPGTATLSDGTVLHAGSLSTTTTVRSSAVFGSAGGFDPISFPSVFTVAPSLLAQVQTTNSETGAPGGPSTPWLTAAVQNLSAAGAELSLERAEVNDGSSVTLPETIGYLAITPRASQFSDGANTILYDAFITGDTLTGWDDQSPAGSGVSVSFNQSLGAAPLVIGNLARRDGGDGGWLRRGALSGTSVRLTVDEDQFNDTERNHTTESASLVAFSQAFQLKADALPDLPYPTLRYRASQDTTSNTRWENINGEGSFYWTINANTRVGVPRDVGWGLSQAYVFPSARGTMPTLEGFGTNPTDESASFVLWFRPFDLAGKEILWELGGAGNGVSMAIDGASLLFTACSNSALTTQQLVFNGLTTDRFTQAVGVIDLSGSGGSTAAPDLYLYVNGGLADAALDVTGFTDWTGADDGGMGMTGGSAIGGNYTGLLNGFGQFSGHIAIFDFYGSALGPNDVRGLWRDVTVPEPGTLTLLALPILTLARRRTARKRRRKRE